MKKGVQSEHFMSRIEKKKYRKAGGYGTKNKKIICGQKKREKKKKPCPTTREGQGRTYLGAFFWGERARSWAVGEAQKRENPRGNGRSPL